MMNFVVNIIFESSQVDKVKRPNIPHNGFLRIFARIGAFPFTFSSQSTALSTTKTTNQN